MDIFRVVILVLFQTANCKSCQHKNARNFTLSKKLFSEYQSNSLLGDMRSLVKSKELFDYYNQKRILREEKANYRKRQENRRQLLIKLIR